MSIWRNLEKNREIINQAAASRAFIVFDTETTGLTDRDQIVELAALKCRYTSDGFAPYEELHLYIKPDVPMSEKAAQINGLTEEFLSDKPTERDVFLQIKEFMGEEPVLGAYNSPFDVKKLSCLYRRCGDQLNVKCEVDLLKIARDIFCEIKLPNHKLCTIANTYGVDEGIQFHSAMDDVKVTVKVLNCMIEDLKNPGPEKEQKKARVYRVNYFPMFRGMSRIYVVTSVGTIYYSLKESVWGSKDNKVDLSSLDMDYVEKQIFAMYGCNDYKSVFAAAKKEYDAKKEENSNTGGASA